MLEWASWQEPLTESNCYVLSHQGQCIVVDPNDPKPVLGLLSERGWTPQLIFLTHEHCDHMAALDPLRGVYPQVQAVMSTLCDAGIQDQRLNMTKMMEVYLTFHGHPGVHYPPFTCRPADVTFEGRHSLDWMGHTFTFVPLPGHTPGGTGIFLDDTHFFSGDYLLPTEEVILRLPGGSQADYDQITLPFLNTLPKGITICPGHGERYVLK